MSQEPIKEKIVMELDASGIKANSLSGMVTQLEQVEVAAQKVNRALANMAPPPSPARSTQQLEAQIKGMQTRLATQGGLTGGNLAKGLKLEEQAFKEFLSRNETALVRFNAKMQEFLSPRAAAQAVSSFEREQVKRYTASMGQRSAALGDLLKPTVASVHGIAGNLEGKVTLEIPAAQVQASVVGPIALNIPGSQIAGTGGGGGGRDPETGLFTGGSRGKKAAKGPLEVSGVKGELQRVRVETEKYLRETITAVEESGNIVSTVHDSVEGIIKTSQKQTTGTRPLEQFREARRLAEENFKQLKASLSPNDPGIGLAAIQKKQAEQLRALLQAPFMKQLSAPGQKSLTAQIEEQARTLEARSQETFAQAFNFKQYGMAAVRQRLGTKPLLPSLPPMPTARAAVGRRGYTSAIGPNLPQQPPPIPASARPGVASQGYAAPIGPPAPAWYKPPAPSPFARGLKSFTPIGLASNIMNVAGWASAVGVLYKSVELASYSLGRLINVGEQTARLGTVFRGVGGNAKELTDDIIQLASANGRDTEEAMGSATEWSRLGLTRVEVNEAVRVSLEAANVAHMHAGETTKQLASLLHIYNLEVGDLDGVLGMLTTTSQRYNVTLEDLFQGLDRSAGGAKLAKIGLAELQGMIGTVVGKTGQSGTVVGNTLKSMFVQFSNPDVQQYLRRFGIETLDKKLGQKSGSQILQEMFMKWQTMDDRQKQSLTWRLVGRQNASRFVPVMDDYLQSQRMAIESQLNLNSAQEANTRIVGTMKSQLAGLMAEYDRLVVMQANMAGLPGSSPMEVGTNVVGTGKNLLKAFNTIEAPGKLFPSYPGGPPLTTLIPGGSGFAGTGFLANKFNKWMDSRDPQMQKLKAAMEFQERMQRLNSESGAMAMRGRLLETIATVLPNAKGDALGNMTDVAASQLGGGAGDFRKMLAGGNLTGAQKLLRDAAAQAQAQALQKSGQAYSEKTEKLAGMNLSLQDLNAEISAMKQRGASQSDLNEKLAQQQELEGQIREMETDRSRAADDYAREAAEVSDVVELKQQYINLLKEEEMLMQGINQLSEQQTLGTAGSRMDAQTDALATQIDLLKAQKDALDERGGSEDTQASEELRKQIADLESRKAALESPQVKYVTSLYDNRQIAARRAHEESDSYAVGYTESEKLLNQERGLRQAIGRTEAQPFRSDNDRVRIKELEISLWQTQEKIQSRIIDLARQEKQIRIDSTREFQKSLLMAGPGEQLQRLYVSSLASRKLGSGEFNALSPELKRMYYELQGGEAGAKTREEQRLLNGRGQTVEQEQTAYGKARAAVAFSGGILERNAAGQLRNMPGMPLPELPPMDAMVTSGRAAAEQMGILAGSAGRAAIALNQLPDKIALLATQAVRDATTKQPSSTSAPKLGVQSGFALGAH